MSNLLNSQNINITNEIAAKKLSKNDTKPSFIEAPQSLPKYSISKVLQEKDEFRKTIAAEQNKSAYKKNKKNILPKIGFILAAVAGFLILKRKK